MPGHPVGGGWVSYAGAIALVACFAAALRLANTNAGAAAPVLLLAVLIVARTWGTAPALLALVTASLSFSYYFLPPVGFGIADPADWVAFVTFTVTALIVVELAARAERRHLEAQEGRREIERLYQELRLAFDRTSEAEAARRNEQLKAALLDALTHNLRTPLTGIKAAVTALIGAGAWSGAGGLSLEQQHELLQVINEESDRLNRFIEGLSATGSAGQSPPTSRPSMALEPIIRAALARADTLTRAHRVVVGFDDRLPAVSVDAAAVTEVLYILLDNASKYAPPGTTIRVSAERDDDGQARILVTDDGPGIGPQDRERVFESFFRIPTRDAPDPRPPGAGLGLSIARRLVETQAGRMWIETPAGGRGTTFAFTLPSSVDTPGVERPVAAMR